MEDDVEDDLETLLAVVFLNLGDLDELVFLVVFRTVFVFLLNLLDLFFWVVAFVELDEESAGEPSSADDDFDSSCFDCSLFPDSAFLVFLAGFLMRVNSGFFFFELGSIILDSSSGSESSALLKSSLALVGW